MSRIKAIFAIPELRQKILLTLVFLAIYRIGFHIPLPFLDQSKMYQDMGDSQGALGQVLGFVSMFSGGNLSQATIFGLGIMPYISASIIFQLLASFYPPLEKLQKEGESGRKKINEYTRYATVPICIFQAAIVVRNLIRPSPDGMGLAMTGFDDEFNLWYYGITAVLTMTAGTLFLMWLGEQIDEYGIGNGISLIIMAGIVGRIPAATKSRMVFGLIVSGAVLWHGSVVSAFDRQGYVYIVMYIAMIYFFCYFWTAITFNPKEMANNLKDHGSFIPGYRPGKSTADYLEKVLMRITYVGAAFLAIVAIIPNVISAEMQIDPIVAGFYGGTGPLIVISVALD